MEEKKIPRRQSKKDQAENLLRLIEQWQKNGDTLEQATNKLTMEQYDILIDYGVNLDNAFLTAEQQKAITAIKRTERPKGMKYKKIYPKEKQDLFNGIVNYLKNQGAEITPKERENFRDLDFLLDNTVYRIVLSTPRKK